MDLMVDATVRTLRRMFADQVLKNTAVNTGQDYYEVATLPAIVLDAFELRENTEHLRFTKEYKLKGPDPPESYTAKVRKSPQWFDMKFMANLLTKNHSQLMTLSERMLQFIRRNSYFTVIDRGVETEDYAPCDEGLEMRTEDLALVNDWMSNRSGVKMTATRFIVQALPIYDGEITETELVLIRELKFQQLPDGDFETFIVPQP